VDPDPRLLKFTQIYPFCAEKFYEYIKMHFYFIIQVLMSLLGKKFRARTKFLRARIRILNTDLDTTGPPASA
jgi:hypothetical protein